MRISLWRYSGRRRAKQSLWLLILLGMVLVVITRLWYWSKVASGAMGVPPPLDHDLRHLRRSRKLMDYLDGIQLLIEPSSTACEGEEEVPLVVVVSSLPSNLGQRDAIRQSWAGNQPTFFVLGMEVTDGDEGLSDTYIEAKGSGDMVVFDLQEHYTNLTLKTALMLHWVQRRCPHAGAVFKTDDDVFVNPWVLREVVETHTNKQLIGYKIVNSQVHRDEYTKWHLPRWLYPQNHIPEYLSGTGYIVNGEYLARLNKAAEEVPLINLEDVYFTHNVARSALGLTLTHDRRLSPFKPWLKFGCSYWGLASSHSLTPDEILDAWSKVYKLSDKYERVRDAGDVCGFFDFLSSDWMLF